MLHMALHATIIVCPTCGIPAAVLRQPPAASLTIALQVAVVAAVAVAAVAAVALVAVGSKRTT